MADSDGDTLPDGVENPDEAFVAREVPGSDPNSRDTDGDGYDDGEEVRYGINPASALLIPGILDGLVGYWPFL